MREKEEPVNHLYDAGAKLRMLRKFVKKYGKRGKYIYGAVVGKVERERERRKRRKRS